MSAAAHAVLVLAGGLSRRLGQHKQLLRREGEAMIHRAVRLGQQTAPSEVVVVLPGSAAPALAGALQDLRCRVLVNPAPQSGLAGSLHVAAPLMQRHRRVLVLTCDQPALEHVHLQQLLQGAAGAVARCAATLHAGLPGVPAVVPGAWFEDMGPQAADEGFRARLRGVPAGDVWLLHAAALEHDLDTADDVQAARAAGLLDPE